jgi:hypothetical protein
VRLVSRLLVECLKERANQALAGRLWHAANDVERLDTTHVPAKKILQI